MRIDPGYARASTASRLDAFLLPDSLHFAEYNAESPAGPGYTQRLCELFDSLDVMARFRDGRVVALPRDDPAARSTRWLRATASGAARHSRHRSPSSTGARCRPGPSSRSCSDAFTALGVPTLVCDPRDLAFDGGVLGAAGHANRSRLPPRAHQRHRRAAGRLCARWSRPTQPRAVCMANTLRCKLAHKKAFFAVLTDERERVAVL